MPIIRVVLQLCIGLLLFAPVSPVALTLTEVRERGEVRCGVSSSSEGFSYTDREGVWRGLNVDFCRAVAAAVLGDADKVSFTPLTETNRVAALLSGDVDLLAMNIGWSLRFDTGLGLNFCGVTFYGGQGFLVPARLGVQSVLELDGTNLCLEPAELDRSALVRYFSRYDLDLDIRDRDNDESIEAALTRGRCDAVSGAVEDLHRLRLRLAEPDRYRVLPEIITRLPYGPVVRQGDDGWFDIVRWVLFALVIAEDEGVTAAGIDQLRAGEADESWFFSGRDEGRSRGLGLNGDWAYQTIRQVGNYGEIFARNLGQDGPLEMERGLNELWRRGGLHYAPVTP